VPSGNGKLIAEKIPGARLVMLPQASHIFITDQAQRTQRAIMEFLEEQNTQQPAVSVQAGRGI
jgi:pimeloyl-ACP methyl ester carboxylesterase